MVFQAAEALLNGVSEANGIEVVLDAALVGSAIHGAGLFKPTQIQAAAARQCILRFLLLRMLEERLPRHRATTQAKHIFGGVQIRSFVVRSVPGLNAETRGLYTKASSRFQA